MKVKSDAIMEVEKKHSRGGLFHLFDWNGKSRKKLFLSNAEVSGESKRGKPVESLLKSPPNSMDGDGYNGASSNTRSADFSSASSVTSDEGCGSRAPGVVARLMGLDSLPTPDVSELSSTTYSGSCSLRVSHYERSLPNLWNECQLMDCSDISNKFDGRLQIPLNQGFIRYRTDQWRDFRLKYCLRNQQNQFQHLTISSCLLSRDQGSSQPKMQLI